MITQSHSLDLLLNTGCSNVRLERCGEDGGLFRVKEVDMLLECSL